MESSINKVLQNSKLSIGNVPQHYTDQHIAKILTDNFGMSQRMFFITSPRTNTKYRIFFIKFACIEQMMFVFNNRSILEKAFDWKVQVPFSDLKLFASHRMNDGMLENIFYLKSSDIIELQKLV